MNLSDARRNNLSTAGESAESDSAQLVARARVMMVISAITTILAVAAVITVIGYRVFNQGGGSLAAGGDDAIALPKGARVVSTSASAGRLAVLIEVDGASELRTFDIRTLKQVGRVRFVSQP
ncbi:MAG: hypothetical protein WAK55_03075 [Xanthobacteraceae bacterium]